PTPDHTEGKEFARGGESCERPRGIEGIYPRSSEPRLHLRAHSTSTSNDLAAQRPPHRLVARLGLRRSAPCAAAGRCSRGLAVHTGTTNAFYWMYGDWSVASVRASSSIASQSRPSPRDARANHASHPTALLVRRTPTRATVGSSA